jgi:hypothetical protein
VTIVRNSIPSLMVVLLAGVALGQGTYTHNDVPGALFTIVAGLDAGGDIVGTYGDVNRNNHGFLLSNGIYTTIDFPGAGQTALLGINDLNQIVGSTDTTGFTYDPSSGVFTPLNYPNVHGVTYPLHINNSGTIVGCIESASSCVGFEFSEGVFRRITPAGFPYSTVHGINNLGVAIGNANSADFHHPIASCSKMHSIKKSTCMASNSLRQVLTTRTQLLETTSRLQAV